MTDFSKIDEARKAGYSSAEIADFLAGSDQRIKQARAAGYSDDEILDHLSPPPSPARQALDAVGDFAGRAVSYLDQQKSKVVSGVAGLPRAAAEGYNWLARKDREHGGVGAEIPQSVVEMLPTSQQVFNSTRRSTPPLSAMWDDNAYLKWANEKKGTLEPERTIHPYVDAAVQGLLGGALTKVAGLPGVVASVTGPVGGEVAGDVARRYDETHGTNIAPWATVGGSLLGAGGGYGAGMLAQKAGTTAKALAAPFTGTGRDRIVGGVLRGVADDPEAAIARMETYTPPVSGFNLTAAKASGDDSLMAAENALDRAGAGFGERVNANNVALTRALDALDAGMDPRKFVAELAQQDASAAQAAKAALDALPAGADAATAGQAIRGALRGRFEALDTARSTAVDPLYAEARAFPEDLAIGPLWQHVDDVIANTKGDVQAAAIKAKGLLTDVNGRPDWSAAGMSNARNSLSDMIKAAEPGSYEQRVLMGIKAEIDKSLSAVPAELQARQTFAALSKPLEAFDAAKGYPANAGVIEKDRFGSNFLTPAEKVPATYFRPGDAGAATMKEFLAAQPDASAVDAMKSFIADKARASGDVRAFLVKHQPAIEALDPHTHAASREIPSFLKRMSLARQLEAAAATGSISSGFRASPAGRFLDNDLDAAMRSTLGASDSVKRMQALRMSVGSNPEAVQGLQKAVIDDFRRAAGAVVGEDVAGNPDLVARGAAQWLQSNRGAIANVLSPDQVAGLEAIGRALKDQAQTAVKVAGSDTGRNLATKSILEAALWKGAGDAAWLSSIRKTLGLIYGGANEKALERLTEVLLDPKAAAALMRKATPGNVKMAEPVLASIGRGAAIPAQRPREGER